MALSTESKAIILLIASIGLVVYAYYILKKRNGFPGPRSLWLQGSGTSGAKDLDNDLINFYHAVLQKHIAYYGTLTKADRRKFINRLHDLIEHMSFIGRQGQEINLKVSILSCAPMIQITMGLDTYVFNSFHTIVLYPSQFYSDTLRTYVKGGVSNGDAIFFSYQDLLNGYAIPNDALNLGLHEMAHAVHIEYFDDAFEQRFPEWQKIAEQEVLNMRHQDDPILRNYAGQNKHELFAVCVETFFEQSTEMKQRAPELYKAMCNLLNQYPDQVRS